MKNLLLIFLLFSHSVGAQVIVTAVGDGSASFGGDGGPATAAGLYTPYGIALDNVGNLYICDAGNARIRKVSPGYGGVITTIAGNGTAGYSGDGGLGIYAQLRGVIDVAIDVYGNIYIADQGNSCIRKVTPLDTITTIAGTGTAGYNGDGIPATAAQLNYAGGVTVDSMGNIYIADDENHRIRMVDTQGIIHTIAGTGIAGFSPDGSLADTVKIGILWGIRIDNAGNIYYADSSRVRKINGTGIISTVAGNGIEGFSGDGGMATAAEIGGGGAIGIDDDDNLYISDGNNNRVREVNAEDGIINTIAGDGIEGYSGDGGDPLLAELNAPNGVAVDDSGDVYIGDMGNSVIRLITKHPLSVSNIVSIEQSINVYPNPCHNYCTVQVTSAINEQADIVIDNITGADVYKFKMLTNQPFTMQMDWPTGVYIINVTTTRQHFNQKIVIQ